MAIGSQCAEGRRPLYAAASSQFLEGEGEGKGKGKEKGKREREKQREKYSNLGKSWLRMDSCCVCNP